MEDFLAALANGHSRENLCWMLDKTPAEIGEWIESDPAVRRQVEIAEARGRFQLEATLMDVVMTPAQGRINAVLMVAKSKLGYTDKAGLYDLMDRRGRRDRSSEILAPDLGEEGESDE